MGDAMYINTNLYNEKFVCDICNSDDKKEFTKFIKYKKVCTTGSNKKGFKHKIKKLFKRRSLDKDITLHVCQSCISRAFRKYDSKI